MRKSKKLRKDEAEVDMTPMLDIVFIMLIFFIVTTSFVKEDAIELLRPSSTIPPDNIVDGQRPIIVSIDENNQISFEKRLIDITAVGSNIESARISNPKGMVIVKAAESASTGVVVSAVDQARGAGAEQVTVAKVSR